MYLDFYQLRERPFNVTADPKFLYLNACYREALASLQYGITQRKGFVTLIGEAGTGKTTLLKKLLDDLDASTRTVFLFNTNVSFDEILEYVFSEFDLPVHNGKRLYMLQRLNAFLLDELREGRNVALLIDEAQDLEFSVLEDLRLLSNLETAKEKILQIVLSGQPELGQKLGNPSLRQLRQRIAINCRLQPLARDEISEYIQARFVAAGAPDLKIFSRDAEDRIFEISKGIPRVVNVICDNALVIGYALGKKRIGGDVVDEASADLFPPEPEEALREPVGDAPAAVVEPSTPRNWRVSQVGMIAVVVGAILIGLLSVGRSLLRRDAAPNASTAALSRSVRDVVPPGERVASASDSPRRAAAMHPADRARSVDRVAAPAIGPRIESAPPADPDREGSLGEVAAPAPAAAPPPAVAARPEPPVLASRGERSTPGGAEAGPAAPLPAAERVKETTVTKPVALAAAPVPRVSEPAPRAAQEVAAVPPVVPVAAVVPRVSAAASAPGPGGGARTADAVAPPSEPEVSDLEPVEIQEEAPPLPAAQGSSLQAGSVSETVAMVTDSVDPQPASDEAAHAASDRPARAEDANDDRQLALAVPNSQSITARPGDSVSGIAIRKYGVASHTILDLMKLANPSIRDIDEIAVGQELKLPQLDQGLALLEDRNGRYALLLLSTPHQRRANEIEAGLRRHGVHTEVRRTDFGRGQLVYRLIVPNLSDREKALSVGRQLQRLLREDQSLAAVTR